MVQIPDKPEMTPETAYQELQAWWRQQVQLRALKTAEVLKRKDLTRYYFAKPTVGVNRLAMDMGFDLVFKNYIDYTVDEAAFDQIKSGEWKKHKIDPDELVRWKPELNVRAYNALSSEQKRFVDEFITTKEQTPQLSIEKRSAAAATRKYTPRKAAAKKTTRKRK